MGHEAESNITTEGSQIQDSLYRDEEKMEESANVAYLLTLGILLGLALRELNKKTKFPYSPMVLTCGLLIGLLQSSLGYLGESASILSHMHPHLIVYVFVPVLLFESAFNCDWYIFKYQIVNILLLAGPGVGWGAILLGIVFKLFLFYSDEDMNWYQAFTLGSVLSATDPVAVVALLKELGASSAFNHLIEGEALLNDGVAMVFFIFFNKLSKAAAGIGGGVTFGGVLLNFFRNSIVGPILGVVVGFFGALWARRIVGDDVEVGWLTFIFTYLTFYWAEFCFFKTSGLLAVVSLGLFWSAFGKTKIRSESEHAVHTVWSFVQYFCDTTVFLLVGMIVGTEVIEERYIYTSDYFRMIVFYFFMILCRYLMVISFWPLLKRYGYPMSQPELIVFVYGGLRGALGLTLSLMVGCDQDLPPRFRHLSVFFTAGMAALTNLVNGTTCKALVNYLNMIENPVIKKRVYKRYLTDMIVNQEDTIKELEGDEHFAMADWNHVKSLVGSQQFLQEVVQLENEIKQIQGGNMSRISYEGLTDTDTFGEVRYRVLRILKGLYYSQFEHGQCDEDSVRLLVESSDVALDHTGSILNIWEQLFNSFTSFSSIKYFFKAKEWTFLGGYAQQYITKHLGFVYDVTTTFISCANEVLTLQEHMPMNKNAVRLIMDEIRTEINKAELYLGTLTDTFPEVIRAIQTKRASHTVLMHQRHHLEENQKNGLVDDKEFNQLKSNIDARLVQLENHVFDWQIPTFHSFAMEFPIFAGVPKEELDTIIKSTYEKRYQTDEIIYEKGMTCQNIYIVQKGNVIDEVGSHQIKKGLGSLLSYVNLIGDGKCMTTSRAASETVLHSLNLNVLKSLMQKSEAFEQKIYVNSIEYLIKLYQSQAGPLGQMEQKRLNLFLRQKAQFKKFDVHSNVEFMFGGYIIKGEIQSCIQDESEGIERYNEYCYVPPRENDFNVIKPLICLVFDDAIDVIKQDRLEQFNLENHEEVIEQRFSRIDVQQKYQQQEL
ncbi:unnamed protein product [Paramecium primaurelia]|uniref:Cyclic nucleotide-binding domain-containing protein n=1 Tax=Paramecium primaurelia TaxID=5886 RepID=A0A8S1NJI6_PARPR|nr:unnamed protein product [Paramecium primaurelia]